MDQNEAQWSWEILKGPLLTDQTYVWRAFLDVTDQQRESLLALLSSDEVSRASQFRFERDRRRFIAARGRLRQILGHYLKKAPQEVRFTYTTQGKPLLAGDAPFRFNLSHSGDFALYAITRERQTGIDIERIRNDVEVETIAQSFFSPGEINSLKILPESKRRKLFFQYWVRKEAVLKATGEGISFPLAELDVSVVRGKVWSPVTLPGDQKGYSRWYVRDLLPIQGYAAAIGVEGPRLI